MEENKKENLITRSPAAAGSFYSADRSELSSMIDEFLLTTPSPSAPPLLEKEGSPRILIVPHAGYVYSGQTAAQAFKQVQGKNYDKVILLGNSHQEYFSGLALENSDVWQTPLGEVEIDKELVNNLVKYDKINIDNNVHATEHSLEVEVPFLQEVLGDFKLVPGLFGSDENLEYLKLIAKNLASVSDDRTLIVISTDLSHYPNYEDAKVVDNKLIEVILEKDTEKFLQTKNELESAGYAGLSTCACGWPAIAVSLELAKELNLAVEFLNYTNSGDTPYGDKTQVVGYAAIIFKTQDMNTLNSSEQQVALKLARQTLENSFDKDVKIDEDYKSHPIFNEKRGVFVTLHKQGELRGCIGLIEPPEIPLSEAIQQMALSAAFNDSRFTALTQNELDEIDIEISVLTVPQKIQNIDEIELGKHGVIIKKGLNSGVFLPQVATETGWTKQEFLSELCSQKAGLPANCYQDPDIEIYIYEAQVFSEKE